MTINRFCSSGLQAIALAAGAIALGSNDIVVAGGVESMTMVPMTGNKLSASPEAMAGPVGVHAHGHHRGERGKALSRSRREDQDAFALWSQKKAAAAKSPRASSTTRSSPSTCKLPR
jgi:acetyl-CoA acyltransferase